MDDYWFPNYIVMRKIKKKKVRKKKSTIHIYLYITAKAFFLSGTNFH